ncbi:hypothetical protein GCM10010885_13100 [Alicyclobacillus cellulosilyticus]|uniref:Sirohydrochlorin ferrochelatase n=1 Tax=Alicyclobacillus cellulosilyticus TaxID=1003997 RepID=A0A917NJ85_9BACL|nr:sirohydrochlorin chelatase [Alicyclobacillus cellulosilyticus]GGJ05392.1 hypothetical protein GCM10010885_13100 [Alicyclobacillus cellulosilyticus]
MTGWDGTGIVFAGHGTREDAGVAEFHAFVSQVADQVVRRLRTGADEADWVPPRFVSGFLELAEPGILDAIAEVYRRGARRVLLVPLFLFAAGHLKHDLPALVQDARARWPDLAVATLDAVGWDEAFAAVAAERLQAAGFQGGDGECVLFIGRGNRDAKAQAEFVKVACGIAARAGARTWVHCFLAGTGPTLEEGLAACAALAPKAVYALPYLWFQGYLTRRLPGQLRAWEALRPGVPIYLAGHLGVHPRLVARLAERVAAALREIAAGS